MNNITLLPCPFCGVEVELPYPQSDRILHPSSFKKPICPFSSQLVVIERWNTRVSPSIPMDVAEKMYNAITPGHNLAWCMTIYGHPCSVHKALSLAEKHGLGKKDKPNT